MSSDNVSGAVNQQERLDAYIPGYVDGEGSFHVAIQRNPSTTVGWQLVPEFHVSQNPERRQVLDLIVERLGCGRIRENHRGTRDTSGVGGAAPGRPPIEGHPVLRGAATPQQQAA